MAKFNKGYISKIISLIVAVTFFLNSTVYGIDLPNKTHLRVPVGQRSTLERISQAMDESIGVGAMSSILADNYGLSAIAPAEELLGGVANEIKPILITTQEDKFVFKSLGNSKGDAQYIVSVQNRLHEKGIPVSEIRKTNKKYENEIDDYIVKVNGSYFILEEYKEGGIEIERKDAKKEHLEAMGRLAAKIQNAVQDFVPQGKKKYPGREMMIGLKDEVMKKANELKKKTKNELTEPEVLFLENYDFIIEQFEVFSANYTEELRNNLVLSFIHNDLNFGNIRFDSKGEVVAVFDLGYAQEDFRIVEFNNLILGKKGLLGSMPYSYEDFKIILSAYKEELKQKLNKAESKAIIEALRSRFLEDSYNKFVKEEGVNLYNNPAQLGDLKKDFASFRKFAKDFQHLDEVNKIDVAADSFSPGASVKKTIKYARIQIEILKREGVTQSKIGELKSLLEKSKRPLENLIKAIEPKKRERLNLRRNGYEQIQKILKTASKNLRSVKSLLRQVEALERTQDQGNKVLELKHYPGLRLKAIYNNRFQYREGNIVTISLGNENTGFTAITFVKDKNQDEYIVYHKNKEKGRFKVGETVYIDKESGSITGEGKIIKIPSESIASRHLSIKAEENGVINITRYSDASIYLVKKLELEEEKEPGYPIMLDTEAVSLEKQEEPAESVDIVESPELPKPEQELPNGVGPKGYKSRTYREAKTIYIKNGQITYSGGTKVRRIDNGDDGYSIKVEEGLISIVTKDSEKVTYQKGEEIQFDKDGNLKSSPALIGNPPANFSMFPVKAEYRISNDDSDSRIGIGDTIIIDPGEDVNYKQTIEKNTEEFTRVTNVEGYNGTFIIRGPPGKKEHYEPITSLFTKENLSKMAQRSGLLHNGNLDNPEITIVIADKYNHIAGNDQKDGIVIILGPAFMDMINNHENPENPIFTNEFLTAVISEELSHERGAPGDAETEKKLDESGAQQTLQNLTSQKLSPKDYTDFVNTYGVNTEEGGYIKELQDQEISSQKKPDLTKRVDFIFYSVFLLGYKLYKAYIGLYKIGFNLSQALQSETLAVFFAKSIHFLNNPSADREIPILKDLIGSLKSNKITTVYYAGIGADVRTKILSTDADRIVGVDPLDKTKKDTIKDFYSIEILAAGGKGLAIEEIGELGKGGKLVFSFELNGRQREVILYREDALQYTPNIIDETKDGYDMFVAEGLPIPLFTSDFIKKSLVSLKEGGLFLGYNMSSEGLKLETINSSLINKIPIPDFICCNTSIWIKSSSGAVLDKGDKPSLMGKGLEGEVTAGKIAKIADYAETASKYIIQNSLTQKNDSKKSVFFSWFEKWKQLFLPFIFIAIITLSSLNLNAQDISKKDILPKQKTELVTEDAVKIDSLVKANSKIDILYVQHAWVEGFKEIEGTLDVIFKEAKEKKESIVFLNEAYPLLSRDNIAFFGQYWDIENKKFIDSSIENKFNKTVYNIKKRRKNSLQMLECRIKTKENLSILYLENFSAVGIFSVTMLIYLQKKAAEGYKFQLRQEENNIETWRTLLDNSVKYIKEKSISLKEMDTQKKLEYMEYPDSRTKLHLRNMDIADQIQEITKGPSKHKHVIVVIGGAHKELTEILKKNGYRANSIFSESIKREQEIQFSESIKRKQEIQNERQKEEEEIQNERRKEVDKKISAIAVIIALIALIAFFIAIIRLELPNPTTERKANNPKVFKGKGNRNKPPLMGKGLEGEVIVEKTDKTVIFTGENDAIELDKVDYNQNDPKDIIDRSLKINVDALTIPEEKEFVKKIIDYSKQITNIVKIKHDKRLMGHLDKDTNTIYLSEIFFNKDGTVDPIALFHELGHRFMTHTALRGLGKDTRRALNSLIKKGEIKDDSEVERIIISIKLELEVGKKKRSLTQEEEALIRYNYENGLRGKQLAYGLQDKVFGKGANDEFTEEIGVNIKINNDKAKKISRRTFIKRLSILGGTAIVAGSIYEAESLYDKIDFFSFNEELLLQLQPLTKQAGEFKIQDFLDEITLLQSRVLSEKDAWLKSQDLLRRVQQFSHLQGISLSSQEIKMLLDFIKNPNVTGFNSISMRWNIVKIKQEVLYLINKTMPRYTQTDLYKKYIKILGKLVNYTEKIAGPDELYLKYFPELNPADILNPDIRTSSYAILRSLVKSSDIPHAIKKMALQELSSKERPFLPSGLWLVSWLFENIGTPQFIEDSLKEISNLEQEDMHYISLGEVGIIRGLRKIPKDITKYFIKSSNAHNLPPRLLLSNLIVRIISDYTIEKGIDLLKTRGVASEETVKKLKSIMPDWLEKMKLGGKFNDFLSGVIINGKNTMGINQIRPSWVQRYDGFGRLGVDASKLSYKKIAWLLLNPKNNIEAAAKMQRGMIEEVRKYIKEAKLYNKAPDVTDFYKESAVLRLTTADPTADVYKHLPDPGIFGGEDWIINICHPAYFDWAISVSSWVNLDISSFWLQKLVIKSGILDNKPAEFVGIETLDDVKKLAELLKSKDIYLRDAAIRSLRGLINDKNPEISKKARHFINKLNQKESEQTDSKSPLMGKSLEGEVVAEKTGKTVIFTDENGKKIELTKEGDYDEKASKGIIEKSLAINVDTLPLNRSEKEVVKKIIDYSKQIKNIVKIAHDKRLMGHLDKDTNTIYLSEIFFNKDGTIDPIALFHELGHRFMTHTALRGLGKDARIALPKENNSTKYNVSTILDTIELLRSEMKRQLTGEEEQLIYNNNDKRLKGSQLGYGLQDKVFGEKANLKFTDRMNNYALVQPVDTSSLHKTQEAVASGTTQAANITEVFENGDTLAKLKALQAISKTPESRTPQNFKLVLKNFFSTKNPHVKKEAFKTLQRFSEEAFDINILLDYLKKGQYIEEEYAPLVKLFYVNKKEDFKDPERFISFLNILENKELIRSSDVLLLGLMAYFIKADPSRLTSNNLKIILSYLDLKDMRTYAYSSIVKIVSYFYNEKPESFSEGLYEDIKGKIINDKIKNSFYSQKNILYSLSSLVYFVKADSSRANKGLLKFVNIVYEKYNSNPYIRAHCLEIMRYLRGLDFYNKDSTIKLFIDSAKSDCEQENYQALMNLSYCMNETNREEIFDIAMERFKSPVTRDNYNFLRAGALNALASYYYFRKGQMGEKTIFKEEDSFRVVLNIMRSNINQDVSEVLQKAMPIFFKEHKADFSNMAEYKDLILDIMGSDPKAGQLAAVFVTIACSIDADKSLIEKEDFFDIALPFIQYEKHEGVHIPISKAVNSFYRKNGDKAVYEGLAEFFSRQRLETAQDIKNNIYEKIKYMDKDVEKSIFEFVDSIIKDLEADRPIKSWEEFKQEEKKKQSMILAEERAMRMKEAEELAEQVELTRGDLKPYLESLDRKTRRKVDAKIGPTVEVIYLLGKNRQILDRKIDSSNENPKRVEEVRAIREYFNKIKTTWGYDKAAYAKVTKILEDAPRILKILKKEIERSDVNSESNKGSPFSPSKRQFLKTVGITGISIILPGCSILDTFSSLETQQIDKQVPEEFLKAIAIFDEEIQKIIINKVNIQEVMDSRSVKFAIFKIYIIPALSYLDDTEKQKFILNNMDLMWWMYRADIAHWIAYTVKAVRDIEIVDGRLQISEGLIDIWRGLLGNNLTSQNFFSRIIHHDHAVEIFPDTIKLPFDKLAVVNKVIGVENLSGRDSEKLHWSAEEAVLLANKLDLPILEDVFPSIYKYASNYREMFKILDIVPLEGATIKEYVKHIQGLDPVKYLYGEVVSYDKAGAVGVFQGALYLFTKSYGNLLIRPDIANDLLMDLFKRQGIDEYNGWVQNILAPELRNSLTRWNIKPSYGLNSWQDVSWQDVMIRSIVGITFQDRYYASSSVEIANINNILDNQGIDRNDPYEFLIGLAYAMNARYFSKDILSTVQKDIAKRHKFYTDMQPLWGGGTFDFDNGVAYFNMKIFNDRKPSIGGCLFALQSELNHYYEYLILKSKNLPKGIKEVEIADRFGSLMIMKQSPFLTYDDSQEYIYSVYKLGGEILENEKAVMDLPPILKKIISHKRMQRINKFIDKRDFSKIFNELTPSEIYYIGYLCADRDLPFYSINKTKISEIKKHLKESGIAWEDFEKEIANTIGILAYKIKGIGFKLTNILLKPYELYNGHSFAERLSADFIIKLMLISKEAGVTVKIQPYLISKALKFLIENCEQADDKDWKAVVDTIEELDVKLMKKWVGELIEEGIVRKGEPISIEERKDIEKIYLEYLKIAKIAITRPINRLLPVEGSPSQCLKTLYDKFKDKPVRFGEIVKNRIKSEKAKKRFKSEKDYYSETTVRVELKELIKLNLVKKVKHGYYELTDFARQLTQSQLDSICNIPELNHFRIRKGKISAARREINNNIIKNRKRGIHIKTFQSAINRAIQILEKRSNTRRNDLQRLKEKNFAKIIITNQAKMLKESEKGLNKYRSIKEKMEPYFQKGTIQAFIDGLKETNAVVQNLSDSRIKAVDIASKEIKKLASLNLEEDAILLFVPADSWINYIIGIDTNKFAKPILLVNDNTSSNLILVNDKIRAILDIIKIIFHELIHSKFSAFNKSKYKNIAYRLNEARTESIAIKAMGELCASNKDIEKEVLDYAASAGFTKEGKLFNEDIRRIIGEMIFVTYKAERRFLNTIIKIYGEKGNTAVDQLLTEGDDSQLEALIGKNILQKIEKALDPSKDLNLKLGLNISASALEFSDPESALDKGLYILKTNDLSLFKDRIWRDILTNPAEMSKEMFKHFFKRESFYMQKAGIKCFYDILRNKPISKNEIKTRLYNYLVKEVRADFSAQRFPGLKKTIHEPKDLKKELMKILFGPDTKPPLMGKGLEGEIVAEKTDNTESLSGILSSEKALQEAL